MGGTSMSEMANAYKLVMKQSEWKRPLRSPRSRWKDNNKIQPTLKKHGMRAWTGFIRLMIGSSDRLL
jgi:hypothetical protein